MKSWIAVCLLLIVSYCCIVCVDSWRFAQEPVVFTVCLHHTDVEDPHELRFRQNGKWKVVKAQAYRVTDDKRELVTLWTPVVVKHDFDNGLVTSVYICRLDPANDYEIVIEMQK